MTKGLPIGLAVALAVTAITAHSADGASRRYQAPRLADGAPDLQGVWTNQTATPMERAVELGTRRAFTDAEAAAISKARLKAPKLPRPAVMASA